MTKAHAKSRMADPRAGTIVGVKPLPSDPMDAATQRENVREFMRAMSAELSILAHRNGLESLALIFEMAREAAEPEAAERPSARS
jgi:hypothetical protein